MDKLVPDPGQPSGLTISWYTYRGIRIVQDRSIKHGYWGRWKEATGYQYCEGSWKELKAAIDKALDSK